jgi:hypothetical protein
MAAENRRDDETTPTPTQDDAGATFKREGPTPATRDSGDSVAEMNRAAEDSVVRNVTPDEQTD